MAPVSSLIFPLIPKALPSLNTSHPLPISKPPQHKTHTISSMPPDQNEAIAKSHGANPNHVYHLLTRRRVVLSVKRCSYTR
ncbi:hypothetical protein NC651_011954 [Populus alba x Populus x berolinensis]|nr:hypothetical protein NC651_011954 [Populus alba x Populus x berolinensis]